MVPLLTSNAPLSSIELPAPMVNCPPGLLDDPMSVRLPPPRKRLLSLLFREPPGLIVITPPLSKLCEVTALLTVKRPAEVRLKPSRVRGALLTKRPALVTLTIVQGFV